MTGASRTGRRSVGSDGRRAVRSWWGVLGLLAATACGPARPPAEWLLELEEALTVGEEPVTLETAFYQPSDLGFDDLGNLHVLDRGNHRVQVFDADGRYVRSLGERGEGPGQLQGPEGLWVDPDGSVLVADTRARRLQPFDRGGHWTDPIGLDFFPLDLVATADRLWVVRFPRASMINGPDPRPLVQVLDRDGTRLADGLVEAAPAEAGILYMLDNLLEIAPAPAGGIAVADTHVTSRLRHYDRTGTKRGEIPVLYKPGAWAPLGQLPERVNDTTLDRVARTAGGLTWDPRRRVWWVLAGHVDRTPEGSWISGTELYRYGPDGEYRGSALLRRPATDVEAAPDGKIWVLDVDGVARGFRVTDPEVRALQ